jgi:hypothetical protein
MILDTSFYLYGLEWQQLDIDVPMYGWNQFAFKDGIAQDAYMYYATEVEIKFMGKNKEITVTPFDEPFENFNNDDLVDAFNNNKTVKSKAHRKQKLKDKKDKK